jgi:hypothetical protein
VTKNFSGNEKFSVERMKRENVPTLPDTAIWWPADWGWAGDKQRDLDDVKGINY